MSLTLPTPLLRFAGVVAMTLRVPPWRLSCAGRNRERLCCALILNVWDCGEAAMEDRSQEGRKHIFAINGAPAFLNVVRDLLQDENYNVTTTNFVPTSFDQITAVQPDALIVDIVIGQSAGWELLEQLHAGTATTGFPVLVLSTDPRLLQQAQEQAARYGTHRYLDKPFSLDALLAQIREMIGEA